MSLPIRQQLQQYIYPTQYVQKQPYYQIQQPLYQVQQPLIQQIQQAVQCLPQRQPQVQTQMQSGPVVSGGPATFSQSQVQQNTPVRDPTPSTGCSQCLYNQSCDNTDENNLCNGNPLCTALLRCPPTLEQLLSAGQAFFKLPLIDDTLNNAFKSVIYDAAKKLLIALIIYVLLLTIFLILMFGLVLYNDQLIQPSTILIMIVVGVLFILIVSFLVFFFVNSGIQNQINTNIINIQKILQQEYTTRSGDAVNAYSSLIGNPPCCPTG